MQLRRMDASSILLLLLLAASEHAVAFGNDNRWESGGGQGFAESIITQGLGNAILVACNQGANPDYDSTISFTLAGASPSGSSIILTFDNEDPESISVSNGHIGSDCRVCADTFQNVLEDLKRHSSVHVLFENGDSARFSLAGSSEAIGECVPSFDR